MPSYFRETSPEYSTDFEAAYEELRKIAIGELNLQEDSGEGESETGEMVYAFLKMKEIEHGPDFVRRLMAKLAAELEVYKDFADDYPDQMSSLDAIATYEAEHFGH